MDRGGLLLMLPHRRYRCFGIWESTIWQEAEQGGQILGIKNMSDAGKSNSNESAISTASCTTSSTQGWMCKCTNSKTLDAWQLAESCLNTSPHLHVRSQPCAAPPVCSLVGFGCSASLPTPGSSERAPHESATPDVNTETSWLIQHRERDRDSNYEKLSMIRICTCEIHVCTHIQS